MLATPTLIKDHPLPARMLVGDMSDHPGVLVALDVRAIADDGGGAKTCRCDARHGDARRRPSRRARRPARSRSELSRHAWLSRPRRRCGRSATERSMRSSSRTRRRTRRCSRSRAPTVPTGSSSRTCATAPQRCPARGDHPLRQPPAGRAAGLSADAGHRIADDVVHRRDHRQALEAISGEPQSRAAPTKPTSSPATGGGYRYGSTRRRWTSTVRTSSASRSPT